MFSVEEIDFYNKLQSDEELNDKGNLNEYDDLNSMDVCVFPISKSSNLDPNPNEDDIVMDVEDLLQLALEERKGKQEAKLVKKNS